jgi:hypothetical protein
LSDPHQNDRRPLLFGLAVVLVIALTIGLIVGVVSAIWQLL